jgi:hypothetical protein
LVKSYIKFNNSFTEINENTEIILIIHADFYSKFRNNTQKIKFGKRFYSSIPYNISISKSLSVEATVIYQNSDTQKKKFLKENKSKSGVYR